MNLYKQMCVLETIKEKELKSLNFSQLANYRSQSSYLAGQNTKLQTPSAEQLQQLLKVQQSNITKSTDWEIGKHPTTCKLVTKTT